MDEAVLARRGAEQMRNEFHLHADPVHDQEAAEVAHALERRDVDWQGDVLYVRRTVVAGVLKPYGKTDRSLRAVPLPARAAAALDGLPARLDSRQLFPGARGGPVGLEDWRRRSGTRRCVQPGSLTARRTPCATPTPA